MFFALFFFHDTATTEIYTLSLHDALPISSSGRRCPASSGCWSSRPRSRACRARSAGDRKSTRLNSSHLGISYAVFCLKKKNKNKQKQHINYQKRHRKQVVTNSVSNIAREQ